jgi:hypothetical protein
MARAPRKTAATPQTVSWTSDDGETIVLPEGMSPVDVAVPRQPNGVQTAQITAPDTEQTAADRVAEMLLKGKQHEQAHVKVQEMQENGDLAYCCDYTCEEFERGGTLSLIRRQWGPGKYRIEMYANDPVTGRFKSCGRTTAIVKPSAVPDAADMVGSQLAELKAALTAAPAKSSTLESMKEMMALAALMREAFGLNAAPPPPPPPLVSQLAELINIMKGAKEIAAEIDPPPETADPLMKIAEQALPIIGKAIENQARPVLAPVQLPPTLASLPANQTQQEDANVNDKEFAALREAIRGINTLAFMDANVELAANLIFDKLPDEAFPILEAPEWFAKLCEIEPGCAKHQAWYQKVRDMLMKFWQEESVEDPPPAADVEPKAA